ncbi:hypothetical protein D3C85_1657670 [compost metagenome]
MLGIGVEIYGMQQVEKNISVFSCWLTLFSDDHRTEKSALGANLDGKAKFECAQISGIKSIDQFVFKF